MKVRAAAFIALGCAVVARTIPASVVQDEAAPAKEGAPAATVEHLAAQFDSELAAAWEAQGIEPAAPADDATWLRRLSLDLLGTIPERWEVAEFLAERGDSKRDRKIDEYLRDPRFAERLALLWSQILLADAGKNAERMEPWLRPWLAAEFEAGRSFAAIVEQLLTAEGTAEAQSPIGYILAYHDTVETLAGVTARAFLGLQIQCAQCHDHPFDDWKQGDFNRFAGFFIEAHGGYVPREERGPPRFRLGERTLKQQFQSDLRKRIDRSGDGEPAMADAMQPMAMMSSSAGGAARTPDEMAAAEELWILVRDAPESAPFAALPADSDASAALVARLPADVREIVDVHRERCDSFARAGFLDQAPYDAESGVSRRAALAEWTTRPENPWFGRAIVNRVVGLLFGKGLIEPVDDLSGSKDRILPDLLERLGAEFVAGGSDLRTLYGALVRTRAYAAGNSRLEDAVARQDQERWLAAHPLRPLSPEQITDSLLRATGRDGSSRAPNRRANAIADATRRDLLVQVRSSLGQSEDAARASIPKSLFLMNGTSGGDNDWMHRGRAAAAFTNESRSAAERLESLYLATVGRPASKAEAGRIFARLEEFGADGTDAIDDVFWALVNSTEFTTNR